MLFKRATDKFLFDSSQVASHTFCIGCSFKLPVINFSKSASYSNGDLYAFGANLSTEIYNLLTFYLFTKHFIYINYLKLN